MLSCFRQVGHFFWAWIDALMHSLQKMWPQMVDDGSTSAFMHTGQLNVGSFGGACGSSIGIEVCVRVIGIRLRVVLGATSVLCDTNPDMSRSRVRSKLIVVSLASLAKPDVPKVISSSSSSTTIGACMDACEGAIVAIEAESICTSSSVSSTKIGDGLD